MPDDVKAELLAINYTNNYVDILVKVPMSFMQTLKSYGLIKTPIDKAKELDLLGELRDKLKGDKTIRKIIKDEIDKANHFICLYDPEREKINYELYRINIEKEGVSLFYKVTFLAKNPNR